MTDCLTALGSQGFGMQINDLATISGVPLFLPEQRQQVKLVGFIKLRHTINGIMTRSARARLLILLPQLRQPVAITTKF